MNIVTRFAPSPTGHLHIGGARTAIFCWLLSRHFGGKFLLRIEDTDRERSRQEYTDSILASMRWLGLSWDAEPVYQSDRMPLYRSLVDKLVASGHAYWCSCTPDEVETMREKARADGKKPRYDGRCRECGLTEGPGRVVRLKAPLEGAVSFTDMVKGSISVDASELDDMVLWRPDGTPTYNMAVVADDLDMGITHVLRGDDHVNNTPKQILIYQALGAELPIFGHVPMILGPDKQKLSKRHGAKAVIEYEQDGLLPQALVNYLVRLGWSHGDQELFSLEELIQDFDGKNLSRAAACFDPDKLLWVNAHHLREMAAEELLPLLLPFVQATGVAQPDPDRLLGLIPLFQPRANSLTDMAQAMRPLVSQASELVYDEKAREKNLTEEGKQHLSALRHLLQACDPFEQEGVHQVIARYVEDNGLKFKAVGPVLRLAIMGGSGGPDLAAVMAVLGKAESLERITVLL